MNSIVLNQKFEGLTAVSPMDGQRWLFRCDCGAEKIIATSSVRRGLTRSCGCLTGKFISEKKSIDLSGQRFGSLIVIDLFGHATQPNGQSVKVWRCQCDCGEISYPRTGSLRSGKTASCGCGITASTISRNLKHGDSTRQRRTAEYVTWKGMRARCLNPNNPDYHSYGGRGIQVCERWSAFEKFLEDMGRRPSGKYSIERLDVNGNYEPGNCIWLESRFQSSNRRNPSEWRGK